MRFAIDSTERPRFLAIARAIRRAIDAGRLVPGAPLPSTRELAAQQGVHRHTVAAAYAELEADGTLIAEEKRCFRVNPLLAQPPSQPRPTRGVPRPIALTPARIVTPDRWFDDDRPLTFDFRSGIADVRSFPLRELKSHMWDALRAGPRLLGYGAPAGHPRLLKGLTDYLARMRAVQDKGIIITHGSQEGILLTALLMVRPGDNVAVEGLGYRPTWEALRLAGAHLVPIAVDEHGLDTEHLSRVMARKRIKLIVTTPLHQYPTTVTMPLPRRRELMALAERHGAALLEDDYDHEFHYRSEPPPPLASDDPADLVFYVSSFSKVLLPTVRLGFMAVPRAMTQHVAAMRRVTTRQNDQITQDALARWLEAGGLERHLRRMRRQNAERLGVVDTTLTKLREKHTRLKWRVPDGGTALWLDLGRDSAHAAKEALERRVGVDPETMFRFDGAVGRNLRLGFAKLTPTEITTGLGRLLG